MESLFSKNYFQLFNFPAVYDIDRSVLTQRYRDMQGLIHPDRFVNATEKERRISMQLTALINEAYNVLKSPLARARYLLQLKGVDIDDSVTSKDIVFLTEQIELRERLEDARQGENAERALMQLASELQKRLMGLQLSLEEVFMGGSDEALVKAHRLYDEMQFISRLNDELDEIEDAFN
ncbi:MAG: Fe-S protein assembly co-chaperone HscB [Gammaproteobacteria bacterium]|nr:Fe-S protein assembly co-chaperone HscB [Gammaproteobacteria bacterium]